MHTSQYKTETLNARIEPRLKSHAERILKKLGLSNAEAIRLFYTQICLNNGLPFDIKIPNKITTAAMDEIKSGNSKKFSSVASLIKELDD